MIIKFTSQEIKHCQEFANSIDTGFYATRNQFNKEKRTKDQVIGKLAEFAVHSFFKEKEMEVTKPDLQIYNKSKKSWDFDLKGKDLNLHVKSQSVEQGKKYGISWIFENSDKHIFRDIGSNDYVCFVIVDLDKQVGEIKSIVKLQKLHESELFKKPKLAYLTTKSAVYLDDLTSSFKDLISIK